MKKDLKNVPAEAKIKALIIMNTMEREIGVKKDELLSKSRKDNIAVWRGMCFHILVKVEKVGPVDASAIFGRDHATALHGLGLHQDSYDTNFDGYQEKYEKVISRYLYERDQREKGESGEEVKLIAKIDDLFFKLQSIKNSLMLSRLTGAIVEDEVIEYINEIFPDYDKRGLIEENIADGIQLDREHC